MKKSGPIVLFDGECMVCNRFVAFILNHERDHTLLFASLQSEIGQQLLKQYKIRETVDSVVLIKDGEAFIYANAVLKLLDHMRLYLRCFKIAYIVPGSIRDFCYKQFAAHRLKFQRKEQVCQLLKKEELVRFLS